MTGEMVYALVIENITGEAGWGFASLVGDIHIKLEHTALITCATERCSGEGYDEFTVGTGNGFRCKRCALRVAAPPPWLTVGDLVRHLCAGHRHARVCKGLPAYPDSIAGTHSPSVPDVTTRNVGAL